MDDRYIAAADLGSGKISLAVALVQGNDMQVVYYKSKPSAGIKSGAAFNPTQASAPLRELIEDAENEFGIKISQLAVGMPRCDIKQENGEARTTRNNPNDSISTDEVESIKSMAQDSYPIENPDKEVIYGTVAQSFSTDDYFQAYESDIIGMISNEFSGHFKLFIGRRRPIDVIEKIMSNLGVVPRMYFSPITTAGAVLSEDERENGVALIELGAGVTSLTIFKNKVMKYYASIPFGGSCITNDIKSECVISGKLAENIKLAFGACMPDKLQTMSDKILQIDSAGNGILKQVPVKHLSKIVTCRVKELVDAMLYEIQKSGMAETLKSGIVITGGGAELTNIGNYIKELSGYNVLKGYTRKKFSSTVGDSIYSCSASTCAGILLAAKEDGFVSCLTGDEEPAREDAHTGDTPVENAVPEESKKPEEASEQPMEKPKEESKPEKRVKTPDSAETKKQKKNRSFFGSFNWVNTIKDEIKKNYDENV